MKPRPSSVAMEKGLSQNGEKEKSQSMRPYSDFHKHEGLGY